jgi:hypothetical protein
MKQRLRLILIIEFWDLFGIWSLGFGISAAAAFGISAAAAAEQ